MANEEVKKSAGKTHSSSSSNQDFLVKYGKIGVIGLIAIVVIVGGFFAYESLVKKPQQAKAAAAIWKAEQLYRMDSAALALNGDGSSVGFLNIISKYSGTPAGNLAKFYAGSCYMKLGEYDNAIKYLKDFKSDDKLIMVRAYGLIGDAYAEQGKNADAADFYKKAGTYYEDDNFNSPEYLFRAGLMYQELNKQSDAVKMFSIIKDKYPTSQYGREIEKYLARLGEFEN